MYTERSYLVGLWTLVLISFTLFSSCDDDGGGKVVTSNLQEFTPQQNQQIGAALQEYIISHPNSYPVLDREQYASLYAYLDQLYNMLAYTSPVKNRIYYTWMITIINDDSYQAAFSAPGGHLFIYTGLLKLLESESELLSVLGHELMFIDQELITMELKDEFGGFTLADIILENEVPRLGEMADYLKTIVLPEEKVMEADAFAVEVLCPFNYDAMAMKRFLEHIKEDELSNDIAWLVSRPGDLGQRIHKIEKEASECGTTDGRFEERYLIYREQLP